MVRVSSWLLISQACAFPDESGLLQTKQVRVAGLTSPVSCEDDDERKDASGCCTEFCQDGEFRHKLCQDCNPPECAEGFQIVDVEGVCCPDCTPIPPPCADTDKVGWTDSLFGNGRDSCRGMELNPSWCLGNGDYAKFARLSCPASCNVCETCQDVVGWTDHLFGGETVSTCQDMVDNPTWCTDYGAYSRHASLNCPVSCNVCQPACHSLNGCEACVAGGCAFSGGGCQDDCIADGSCWRLEHHVGASAEDVCALKDAAERDERLCAAVQTCGDCTRTVKSDNNPCQWFEDVGCAVSHWAGPAVESCPVTCQEGEVRATDDVCCDEVCQDNGAFLQRCIGCAPCPSHLVHVEDDTCCGSCSEPNCLTREVWSEAKKEWCCANKNLGCEPEPRVCCRALTVQCLSCDAGQTEEEFCSENPDFAGCLKNCDTCPQGYNDGCNDCRCPSRSNSAVGFCTRKACLTQGEPYCLDPEPPSPPTCSELNGCEACLAGGCAFSGGGCRDDCVADASCWRLEHHVGASVEDVCALKDAAEADQRLCGAQRSCGDCTGAVKSDNNPCQWFGRHCAVSSWSSRAVDSCPVCCKALTAQCMSCAAGQTKREFCAEKPDTRGCGRRT